MHAWADLPRRIERSYGLTHRPTPIWAFDDETSIKLNNKSKEHKIGAPRP